MIDEICCEKTRQYLGSFGQVPAAPWEATLASKDHDPNPAAVDLVRRLARFQPEERLDVHSALRHPFFRPFVRDVPAEPACPFKVSILLANEKKFPFFFLLQDFFAHRYELLSSPTCKPFTLAIFHLQEPFTCSAHLNVISHSLKYRFNPPNAQKPLTNCNLSQGPQNL